MIIPESFRGAHPYHMQAFMMSQQAEMTLGSLTDLEDEAMQLRNGNINAIAGLMERYQHRLYRYLLRLVSQPSTAEDLFQQTWMRVMQRIKSYDPRRSFEGWLFAIAHNLAIDFLRRRQPESLDEPSDSGETQSERTQSSDPGALDCLLSQERADWVARIVENLPISFREVLTLRFEEEMKLEEIAMALDIPMGTVKTRLHRALKALRQLMEKKTGIREMP
jgi:RNA polymerase sigma-70 factor, ECF subfamily